MLQQLLHIITISLLCIIWGVPALIILKKKHEETYWTQNGFGQLIFLFFSGLLTISFLSSWVILLIPLKFIYLLVTTLALIIALYFFLKKKRIQKPIVTKWKILAYLPQVFLVTSAILLFTLLSTLAPVNEDTQLYHLQIIRWTNEYGVVPGMANIYPRLGLGSNWFNLISLFYIPTFPNENFTYLNTSIVIWFFLWLMYKWHFYSLLSKEKYSPQLALFYFLLILYFLYDWQLFRDTANSTAYDFIVTVLTIFCLSFIIENILNNKEDKKSTYFLFIAVSIFTFKLSGILIFILITIYLLNKKDKALWVSAVLIGLFIGLPIIIKNHIATGYILYPSSLSIGSPDWKLPIAMTEKFRNYIINVNHYYNYQLGFIDSLEKTNFNWIPYWFKGILIKHKILLGLSLLSFVFLLIRPSKGITQKKLISLFTSLWLMLLTWFFTAPDPRFAYGFLLFLSLLPVSLILKNGIPAQIYSFAITILSCGILYYTCLKSGPILSKPAHLLYPIANENPPYTTKTTDSVSFNYSEKINNYWNNRCYFTPLPCVCEDNPFLKPRGSTLRKGFKLSSFPDSIFIERYNY